MHNSMCSQRESFSSGIVTPGHSQPLKRRLKLVIGIIGAIITFLWLKEVNYMGSLEHLLLSGLGGLIFSMLVGLAAPTIEVKEPPVNLVALRSADGLTGTFVLGTGGINRTASYYFMVRHADGSMSPNEVDANNRVFFTEDSSLKDTGIWTRTVSQTDTSGICRLAFCSPSGVKVVRNDFRLPPGSVVKRFSVD